MPLVPDDWDYSEIKSKCSERADYLSNCKPASGLVEEVGQAVRDALKNSKIEYAIDSIQNKFEKCRSTIQVQVSQELYDWFFNSHNGYRGAFLDAEETGLKLNTSILNAVVQICREILREKIEAKKIEVIKDEYSREDHAAETISVDGGEFLNSIKQTGAKVWIGERLLAGVPSGSSAKDISPLFVHKPHLVVPAWTKEGGGQDNEGLRAPFPDKEYCWLDIKGTFIGTDGNPYQPKNPLCRAKDIHEKGWT